MNPPHPYTVFFGGDLYNAKQIVGNAYLAEAIHERSHGRYECLLPQDFDTRRRSLRAIRDQQLRALVAADAAVFCYEGAEIDAAAVAAFLYAKCADIPAVLLRSDIRLGGDQNREPWNLMTSFFPRTVSVVCDSLAPYRAAAQRNSRLAASTRLAGQHATAAAQQACDVIATKVVRALDRVLKMEPAMPRHLQEEVYQWLALMPGMQGRPRDLRRLFEQSLERKVDLDLL